MQDRILGPLTMIQFVYAVVGGGLCYSIFMTIPKPVSYFLIAPLALFTICMAIVKINERPFLSFFISFLDYLFRPKKRVWHHKAVDNMHVVIYRAEKKTKIVQKDIPHERIEELAKKLDAKK